MMLSPAGTPPRGPDGLVVLDTCTALSYDAWPAAEQSVTLMSSTHSPAAGGRTAQLCAGQTPPDYGLHRGAGLTFFALGSPRL